MLTIKKEDIDEAIKALNRDYKARKFLKTIRSALIVIFVTLFLFGLFYLTQILSNSIYWLYNLNQNFSSNTFALLFILLARYCLINITLSEFITSRKAFKYKLAYFSFHSIVIFSIIWSTHFVYEGLRAKDVLNNKVEYNSRYLCTYHLYQQYNNILDKSLWHSEKTFAKLLHAKLSDIKSGKLEVNFKIEKPFWEQEKRYRYQRIKINKGLISYTNY